MEEALESSEPEQLRMFEDVPNAYRDPASCTEAIRMLGELKKEEARLGERLKRIAEERDMIARAITVEMARNFPFLCNKCGNPSPLHRWVLSRLKYHVPPRGCYEGDYWVTEKLHASQLCCPECKEWNYLYNHRQREHTVLFLSHIDLSMVFDAPIESYVR